MKTDISVETLLALQQVQRSLKVPKKRYNGFGKFQYRAYEDILEEVKKILPDGSYVNIADEVEMIGDRFYVKATAAFFFNGEKVSVSAYAREALTKKGSDESQITGMASSYARKYAMNGLFLIDDSAPAADLPDVDSLDNNEPVRTASAHSRFGRLLLERDVTKEMVASACADFGCSKFSDLPEQRFAEFAAYILGENEVLI